MGSEYTKRYSDEYKWDAVELVRSSGHLPEVRVRVGRLHRLTGRVIECPIERSAFSLA
ncbi:hypothetical protein ACTVZO_13730 [Streptomyces sp. IBSNAI002]|uniref:hypothetical protein n=1 Tax=Streptomyces sp. IBSNAI002 TaxID=3457500 RepID=UPI003FD3E06C